MSSGMSDGECRIGRYLSLAGIREPAEEGGLGNDEF